MTDFTTLVGGPSGISTGTPLAVDPTFLAARIAARPLEYAGEGQVLGHYKVGLKTGTFTAGFTAAQDIAAFQWSPAISAFAVLTRVTVGYVIVATTTESSPPDIQMFNARGFTAQDTGGAAVVFGSQNQKNRSTMGNSRASVYYANGTAPLTAGTRTLDSLPVAVAPFNMPTDTTAGNASSLIELYAWKGLGQHPEVYSPSEGFIIQNITAGPAVTGTCSYYVNLEWAEVVLF